MDVMNSNNSFDRTNKKKFKRSTFKVKQFSIEIYFLWFNQLIYLTETIVGKCNTQNKQNKNLSIDLCLL